METYRRLLGAKTNPPKDKLPCGLLGSGHFFHYAYVPALNKTNSPLAATGIFSRDENKLREAQRFLRHTLQPFATQEDLFASGIKAALILLPNHLHFAAAQQALERGLHVFCEKPLTNTVADALTLKAVARKAGRVLMTDFNQRYLDRNRVLKEIIAENRAGSITAVHAFHNQDLRGLKSFAALHRDLTGGGVIHNAGIHFINLFLHWFGEVERVSAVFENRALPAECGEDTAHCKLTFRSGLTATLDASLANAVDASYERLQILGADGEFTSDFKKGHIICRPKSKPPYKIPCRAEIVSDSVFNALEHFAHCVKNGVAPETDPDDSIKTLKVIEALTLSAQRGAEVCLKEIESKYAS